MMEKIQQALIVTVSLVVLTITGNVHAATQDDPLLSMVLIDRLEQGVSDGDKPFSWLAQSWLGYDLNKLWFKTEGERVNGTTTDAELQLLYSKAVAPFWDFQLGIKNDFKPSPSGEWVVIGVQGVAPYFFEIDAALFIGDSGQSAFRLDAEYELLITQKLILTPSVEVNLYGKNNPATGTGSGLSDIEAGLRLRYEIVREFAPYIGVNWLKKFGNTADFAHIEGESASETQIVLGLRAWF